MTKKADFCFSHSMPTAPPARLAPCRFVLPFPLVQAMSCHDLGYCPSVQDGFAMFSTFSMRFPV
jgi:hypothetical protein